MVRTLYSDSSGRPSNPYKCREKKIQIPSFHFLNNENFIMKEVMVFIVKVGGMTTCDLIKVWLTCALSDVDEKELQPDTDEYSFISSEESCTFSKVCCSHIEISYGLHSSFKWAQRFWPINLVFTHFCYLLPFLRYESSSAACCWVTWLLEWKRGET